MSKKEKTTAKRGKTKADINLRAAIASGQGVADEVIAFRTRQLRRRAAAESKLPSRRRAPGPPRRLPPKSRALFGTRKTVGVLVAEGDSWFDYPMQDVLQLLEDDYLYDVESVAHKGDCVEDMAYSKRAVRGVCAPARKTAGRGQSAARHSAFGRRQRHCG